MAELIEKYEQEAVYNIAYVLAYRSEADRAFECDPRWLPFLESIGNHRRKLDAIEFEVTLPGHRRD